MQDLIAELQRQGLGSWAATVQQDGAGLRTPAREPNSIAYIAGATPGPGKPHIGSLIPRSTPPSTFDKIDEETSNGFSRVAKQGITPLTRSNTWKRLLHEGIQERASVGTKLEQVMSTLVRRVASAAFPTRQSSDPGMERCRESMLSSNVLDEYAVSLARSLARKATDNEIDAKRYPSLAMLWEKFETSSSKPAVDGGGEEGEMLDDLLDDLFSD